MIDSLQHYLQAWDLTDPQPIAETATSHVYTVRAQGETVVLKILTAVGAEEQHGAVALRWFDGRGAVRLLRHDAGAHLLEYVAGNDLVPLVQRGDDEAATRIIASVLNQLHSVPQPASPDGLMPMRRRFQSLFAQAAQDEQTGRDTIYYRAVPLVESLLTNPLDERVLHGDMHHENIRYHAERGWLAFDPKGLYGERTFDAANTLCNPIAVPELITNETRLLRNAAILAEAMHIPLPRVLAYTFAYACLSAVWFLEDGVDPGSTLWVAETLERHVRV